jgi:hypothetical protein
MPECFSSDTSTHTMEKMLKLASFIAMITAGMRRQDQRSLWISDHDEALETFDRREQLGRLASYLTIGFTGWRQPADMGFGTTEASNLPAWSEDAAAIPDLCAGAFCKLAHVLPTFYGKEYWLRTLPAVAETDLRARVIGNWMASGSGHLRHVLLRLDLGAGGEARTSAQFLFGFQPYHSVPPN